MSGFPKTTLRLEDSLEGFNRFIKAVILIFTVYYSQRMQIKIRKKSHETKYRKNQTQAFRCSLPMESYRDTFNSSSNDV